MKRNKILKILEEYRDTEIGNIALANIIYFSLRDLNNLTTDPLAILLVDGGERCYQKVGNICEVTDTNIQIGKEIYLDKTN